MTNAAIKCVAPWYGSKRRMADRIVTELGKHSAYWGLCCGSLAVEMAKDPCDHEYVVDLHGDLINLCCVLASDLCVDLYSWLSTVVPSDDMFEQARNIIEHQPPQHADSVEQVDESHMRRAGWFLVFSWVGISGFGGTDSKIRYAMRFTTGGGSQGARFRNAVESIPAWHRRLRHIHPLRKNVFEILERIPDAAGVAVYFDPPYVDKSESYQHEFTEGDHRRAAELLSRLDQTRVVISYYDHPLVRELYADDARWRIEDCSQQKSLSLTNRRGATAGVAPELLLVNGPSFEQASLF
jgi:DNA adenine methylase